MSIEFLDIEYLIRKDELTIDGLIISVQSRQNNCSCHTQYSNESLKENGTHGLLNILKGMEENLIFKKTNNLIEG